MPDANKEHTITQLVGAAFGAAGQRCMALSTAIFVGETQQWIPEIIEKAKQLKVTKSFWENSLMILYMSPICWSV